MAKEFLASLETWKKVLLVLACAIFITILLGCLILAYTRWRLRRHDAMEREVRHRISRRRQQQTGDYVPFGARGLESGIQLEGVWLSRTNESDSSSADALISSSLPPNMNQDRNPPARIQSPVHKRPWLHQPRIASWYPADVTLDKAVATRQRISDHSEVAIPLKKLPKVSLHVLTNGAYEDERSVGSRQLLLARTLGSLEGIPDSFSSICGFEDDDTLVGDDHSYHLSGRGEAIESMPMSPPDLAGVQTTQDIREPSCSDDLGLLDNHRTSQVAETEQLTPHGQSCTVDLSHPSARTSKFKARSDDFNAQTIPSIRSTGLSMKPPSSPKFDALPPALQRASMPNVTPFTEFCKRGPPSPSPTCKAPADVDSISMTSLGAASTHTHIDQAPTPVASKIKAPEDMKLPSSVRTLYEKQISPVVRGQGTGFEILRPGSLHPQMTSTAAKEQSKAARPTSLHSAIQDRVDGAESQWRLTKERRSSLYSLGRQRLSLRDKLSLLLA